MNAENHCLGQHLHIFKNNNSEKAFTFKDFTFCFSIFLFCNFQLEIFFCWLGKQYTIFNWEYDRILAMK
jgi:hypothetical protein